MLNASIEGTSERTMKTSTKKKFDADLEDDRECGWDDESGNEGVSCFE